MHSASIHHSLCHYWVNACSLLPFCQVCGRTFFFFLGSLYKAFSADMQQLSPGTCWLSSWCLCLQHFLMLMLRCQGALAHPGRCLPPAGWQLGLAPPQCVHQWDNKSIKLMPTSTDRNRCLFCLFFIKAVIFQHCSESSVRYKEVRCFLVGWSNIFSTFIITFGTIQCPNQYSTGFFSTRLFLWMSWRQLRWQLTESQPYEQGVTGSIVWRVWQNLTIGFLLLLYWFFSLLVFQAVMTVSIWTRPLAANVGARFLKMGNNVSLASDMLWRSAKGEMGFCLTEAITVTVTGG